MSKTKSRLHPYCAEATTAGPRAEALPAVLFARDVRALLPSELVSHGADAESAKARGARARASAALTAPLQPSDEVPWLVPCAFVITALWGPFLLRAQAAAGLCPGGQCAGQAGPKPEDLDLVFILRPFLTLKIFCPARLGTDRRTPCSLWLCTPRGGGLPLLARQHLPPAKPVDTFCSLPAS